MTANEEVELKLQVDPQAIAVLLGDPLFTGHDPVARDQVSTYFDTERRALQKAGLSLRIRDCEGKCVQTLKAVSPSAASLFARGEWERVVASGQLELADISALLPKALQAADAPPLAPIFTVQVRRTSFVHVDGRNRIEVVADRGRIIANGREAPVSEIEIELLDGDRDALFDLAIRLADRVPLRLGVRSKSERGYSLLRGDDVASVKTEPIALAQAKDTAALFETVASACIRQFRLNEDILLASGNAAPIHQARVGLRRLRSAFSIFRTMLAGSEFDRFQTDFRGLAGRLGDVRDIDVMTVKIGDEAVLDTLGRARSARFDIAAAALNSAEIRSLMLDLAKWVSIGAWRDADATASIRTTPSLIYASAVLDRLRRKIKRRGKHLAKLDVANRHQVRITGKKLRYAAEFFSSLYPGKTAGRRREAFLTALEDLQTALGHLNDLATGRALFEELGIVDADRIFARGKMGDDAQLIADAQDAFARLIEVKCFWR